MGSMPGVPVTFYTDLASAPPGAFVTVWGKRFGDTQGASTITLAGAAVDVVSWSDTKIELHLPQGAKAGDLVVTNAHGASPPLPLGVHQGKLYFVAANGSDSYSGTKADPAGGDGPFQSLSKGRDALMPGDVLYLRTNTFTQEDNFRAVLSLYNLPLASAGAPIAIVSYPGETVTLGDGTLQRGISLYHGDNMPDFGFLTIAKLHFKPSCDGIELIYANDGRFVGNEISGAHDACSNGVVETQGTSRWKVLGNHLHDNGNTKLEHGVYLGGYGTQSDWEIAWNRIEAQKGGRAIQLFGHTPQDHIQNVSIHDNEIFDIDRDGIVLGATDADVLYLDQIDIYDNLFVRAGRCVGHGVRVGNDTAKNIKVLQNTFVDDGSGAVSCDQSSGQNGGAILLEAGADVTLQDNILATTGQEAPIDVTMQPPMLVVSHNLYAGAAPSSLDTAPIMGDPHFVDPKGSDLHVGKQSAAIGAGVDVGVKADHDGIARPATPDVGAYQYVAP